MVEHLQWVLLVAPVWQGLFETLMRMKLLTTFKVTHDLKYSSGRVTNYDEDDAAYFNSKLEAEEDYYGAVMNHVAEGVGGSVSSEIEHMFNIGMAGPGMVFVHATDASVEQLARMRAEERPFCGLRVWNLDLYAATTQADVARRMGIPVALGPDWTWSGSMNPVEKTYVPKSTLFLATMSSLMKMCGKWLLQMPLVLSD